MALFELGLSVVSGTAPMIVGEVRKFAKELRTRYGTSEVPDNDDQESLPSSSDSESVDAGGEALFGLADGTRGGLDRYGRPLGDSEFAKESEGELEFVALQRWQGEFARKHGRKRRGRSATRPGAVEIKCDSEEFHQFLLDREIPNKRKMTKLVTAAQKTKNNRSDSV